MQEAFYTQWSADELVPFSGGSFLMGSENGADAEKPQHLRAVQPFQLDRYLTTNADFRSFAEATGYVTDAERRGVAWTSSDGRFQQVPGVSWRTYAQAERERHPVVLVSWTDASEYAAWAEKRLPTEAEWEFAALSIAGDGVYPWGNADPDELCGAGRVWDGAPGTSPVGRFAAQSGVYDLVGNVWQWCADAYSPTAYSDYADGSSKPAEGSLRVRRGGAWNVLQSFRLRCSNRGAYPVQESAPNLGFRCAV